MANHHFWLTHVQFERLQPFTGKLRRMLQKSMANWNLLKNLKICGVPGLTATGDYDSFQIAAGAELGAGLNVTTDDDLEFGVSYDIKIKSDYTAHSGFLRLAKQF